MSAKGVNQNVSILAQGRAGATVHSATKRSEFQAKVSSKAKPTQSQRQSTVLPPLKDTSFSEQYKTFKASAGNPIASNLEMSKELQMRIRPSPANKPYYRRNLRAPNFGAETDPHFLHQGYAPGLQHNVFQTNATHVLAAPNQFNMMADASMAPYSFDTSYMRNPNGKLRLLSSNVL